MLTSQARSPENSNSAHQSKDVGPKSNGPIDIAARFMLPDQSEHACRVTKLSIGGAIFLTNKIPHIGLPIVAYIGDLGRIEATVGPATDGGFTIHYSLTGPRLERLQQRVKALLDSNTGIAQRRHLRVAPNDPYSHIKLPDGRIYPCEVLDISISSAAIKTDVIPGLGTFLMLGRMKGRVVRYLETGVAIEFVKQLDGYQVQNMGEELKG